MKFMCLFSLVILVLIILSEADDNTSTTTLTPLISERKEMSNDNLDNNCKNNICIRKCCKEGEYYSLSHYSCKDNQSLELWTPRFYSDSFQETNPPDDYRIVHGFPCKKVRAESLAYLMSDGTLFIQSTSRKETIYSYCQDNAFNGTKLTLLSLVCFPKQNQNFTCLQIRASLLVVSSVFLLITFIVYILTPELRANLHGKVLISYVIALLVSSVGLAVIQLGSQDLSSTVCKVLHIVIHYCMLSAFFWLNTMAYDVWRSLRSLKLQGRRRSSERGRLILYSLYSWGCPLVISSVTLCIDTFSSNVAIPPSLGAGGCWFYSVYSLWVYLYPFILIIMVINFGLYVDVARILWVAQKTRQKMLKNSTVKDKERFIFSRINLIHNINLITKLIKRNKFGLLDRLKVYFKLFIVMGITWIFEILSAANSNNRACDWWILTDVINALQGVFIFLVFICKRSTCNKLKASTTKRGITKESSSNWNSKRTGTSSTNTTSSGRGSRNKDSKREATQKETGASLPEPLVTQPKPKEDGSVKNRNDKDDMKKEEEVSD